MSPNFRIAMRPEVGTEHWNECADAFADAWLWHRWEAAEAYATWHGTTDVSFALLDPASKMPIALVPARHVLGRRPARRLTSILESTGGPAYAPSLSPRQRSNAERDVRDGLLAIGAREGAHRIELSVPPLAPAHARPHGVNPLAMLGCKDASTQSWILDLEDRDEDALWRNLEHRVRKTVNKAERNGITVRDIAQGDLPEFLKLHRAASARNALSAKPDAYFEAIFGDFVAHDLAAGYCATNPDGRTIAIHIFAIYKQSALYWVVASDAEALGTGANDLVQWHAIRSFARKGLTRYECGEAFPGAPDGKLRRISDFKKGFGGTLAPYYRGVLTPRPMTAATLELLRSVRGTRGDA